MGSIAFQNGGRITIGNNISKHPVGQETVGFSFRAVAGSINGFVNTSATLQNVQGAYLPTQPLTTGCGGSAFCLTTGLDLTPTAFSFAGIRFTSTYRSGTATQFDPQNLFVNRGVVSITETVVPEPATWAMMILGFGAVGYAMRRRPVRRARAL